MKIKKGQSIGLFEVDQNGYARLWLIGLNKYFFRNPPRDSRIIENDENRQVVKIIGETDFNKIKKEKLLAPTLFPYDKDFDNLERLEI
jgi:hypothetical protein